MSRDERTEPAAPRRPRAVRLAPERVDAASVAPGGLGEMPPAATPIPRATAPLSAARPAESVEITPDPYAACAIEPGERAVEEAQASGIRRRSLLSWNGLLWSALGGLVSLGFGLWVTRLVDDAFARAPALGIIGLVLAGLVALALAVIAAREAMAIGRQRRIARLHADIARAHATDDRDAARRLVGEVAALYDARPETARARGEVLALTGEIVDGRDLLDIAERALVAPLDAQAAAAVAVAARRVSAVTALAPRAIVDVLFVAAQAVRLVRVVSGIYGGRPGFFGFLKLARSVASHLAITGGMAAGDAVLQQLVGHGIAAKLSARLGEGMLNGLLTARIGLSAMAVCRPMPYAAERAPSLRKVVPFLFRTEGGKGERKD